MFVFGPSSQKTKKKRSRRPSSSSSSYNIPTYYVFDPPHTKNACVCDNITLVRKKKEQTKTDHHPLYIPRETTKKKSSSSAKGGGGGDFSRRFFCANTTPAFFPSGRRKAKERGRLEGEDSKPDEKKKGLSFVDLRRRRDHRTHPTRKKGRILLSNFCECRREA